MRCVDAVLESRLEELHEILLVLTLKHKQILNAELLILAPTQPQTLLSCSCIARSVEQIVHSLAVYLQEGERDDEVALLASRDLLEQPLEQLGDDALDLSFKQLIAVHRVGLA